MKATFSDADRATAAPAKASLAGWLVPAGLLLLSAIPLAAGVYRLYTLATGEISPAAAYFFVTTLPLVLHIVGAIAFAILGAFQFAAGFRRRNPGWHRAAGRLLVPAGLIVGLSGIWMTLFSPFQGAAALLYAFRLLFGSAMVVSIVLGLTAIRRRDIAAHRAWMTRAYAIGLSAGTQVLTLAAGEIFAGPPTDLSRALLMGAAWAINLAVAERVIRRRPAQRLSSPPSPGVKPGLSFAKGTAMTQ
jgi:uncharacterized membrane protein YozB (DUF420 family)